MKSLRVTSPPSSSRIESSFEDLFFHSPETYIHPTAYVGPNVQLDSGVKVGPYAVITGNVTIGAGTQIYSHAVIGTPAQDITIRQPLGRIIIGAQTIIKEFVTISAPKSDNGTTSIGQSCYCMHFSHIAHDATIENNVVLTNNAQIAGHVYVEKHVLLMAHTAVHQYCRIGAYTALAPFSGCRQDLPPYSIFTQQPATFTGLHRVKLKRMGFSQASFNNLKKVTTLFYRDKQPLESIITQCNENGLSDDEHVQKFLSFIENSERGVSRLFLFTAT